MIEQRLITSSMNVIIDLIHHNDLKNNISVKLTSIINNLLQSTEKSTIEELNESLSNTESTKLELKLFNTIFDEIDAYEV